MRRILIAHARARIPEKRGDEREPVTLTAVEGWNPVVDNRHILDLDQALTKLEKADARAARLLELRFFGGLQENEIAEALGVYNNREADWNVARAWLMSRLQPKA